MTAPFLHPGIPALVLVAQEFRQMKMPYKPAWMPFAEGKYMLPEDLILAAVEDDRHVFS